MPGNDPDTPGAQANGAGTGPRERSTFSIEDGPAPDDSPLGTGYEAPDQTVFDLTMDDDEETLLDWEQYASQRKFYFCGLDCSLVARFCPFMPCVPKEWYHRYSSKQRKLMTIGASAFVGLLILLIGATVLLNLLPQQEVNGLNSECTWGNYHLPATAIPSQYSMALDVQTKPPYMVGGQIEVLVNLTRPCDCVVLHAMDMNVSSVKRADTGEKGTWSFNDKEQIILSFPQTIEGPTALLAIDFGYALKQGLSGFYRSTYNDSQGVSHVLATTQMEANSARKAFPCFDEPALKAKWNVSITADSDQTVLFNMPDNVVSDLGNGRTLHSFQPTPPMSSYLVAFVVGRLDGLRANVPSIDGRDPPRQITIWGTPDRQNSLQPALEVAVQVLPEYERLFGVPYALPKLDLVAIPDFAAGAMENWGLITYRETDLLLGADDSSIQNERRVAVVIAHEMAHLWFGDLVTMKGWGELWLNEGFATYFENIGATLAKPNMAYLETFYADLATSALDRDALSKSTHPLATLQGLDTAEKVEAMFDGIAYDKGGSVLRMLRAYLDRNMDPQPLLRRSLLQEQAGDLFMLSLQQYLRKHQYNSTTSNDLWAEFDDVTGEPVTEWMRSWTFQSGVPRVQVLLEDSKNLKIYQRPFELTPAGEKGCEDPKKGWTAGSAPWWIPIAKSSRDNFVPSWTTLSTCVMQNPIYTLQDDDDWVKLNAGQYGLYRVNYPEFLWQRLATAASLQAQGNAAPAIPAEDLAGLLDDSWALSIAKETPIVHFLDLLKSLSRRQLAEYAPWSVAASHLVGIRTYLEQYEDASCSDKWSNFVRDNVTEPFMAGKPYLGLLYSPSNATAQPDVQARLLRTLLAGVSVDFNVTSSSAQALTLFTSALGSNATIDADIRSAIYAYAAASGRQDFYDAIKAVYLSATDPNEKGRALSALAFAETPSLTQQTLQFVLDPNVRSQDSTSLIVRVAYRGATSLQAAWNFVKENYHGIAEKLGGEKEAANAMGKLISNVASNFASEEAINELRTLFSQHKEYLTEPRLRDSAEESIRTNMDWLRSNAKPICDWLDRQ